jgi:hypothetical protein
MRPSKALRGLSRSRLCTDSFCMQVQQLVTVQHGAPVHSGLHFTMYLTNYLTNCESQVGHLHVFFRLSQDASVVWTCMQAHVPPVRGPMKGPAVQGKPKAGQESLFLNEVPPIVTRVKTADELLAALTGGDLHIRVEQHLKLEPRIWLTWPALLTSKPLTIMVRASQHSDRISYIKTELCRKAVPEFGVHVRHACVLHLHPTIWQAGFN